MNKQIDMQNSSESALKVKEAEMKQWYDNEFIPFKKQKEQEKQDFNEFAKIIINNTQEVKYMLANIYDNNSAKAVETWNALKLEPAISDIKSKGELLIIIDKRGKESQINFDLLLENIKKALGGK
ncbi:MAG TPA: hypothetical protein DCL21_01920 [Alphaproteobacteria bacterium]|nr:hypothetical protein [Alphaproteobacteria bacterium]